MTAELVQDVARRLYGEWFCKASRTLEAATADPRCQEITIESFVGAYTEDTKCQMDAEFMEELAGLLTKRVEDTASNIWRFSFTRVSWSFGDRRYFVMTTHAKRRGLTLRRNRANVD